MKEKSKMVKVGDEVYLEECWEILPGITMTSM